MQRLFTVLFVALSFGVFASANAAPSHGLAIFGDLKYPKDFKNFEYANPDAPKGGAAHLSYIGTYDNLNPFILKGMAATGTGMVFESLLETSKDEPFSAYGLLAESVELAPDRSWVKFNINPKARWSDGSKLTADDVLFTYDTLKTKGHPMYRTIYRDVGKCEKQGELEVKFTFTNTQNRELPLIIGQMPILSKAFFTKNDFEKTTLTPLMGSGPYLFDKIDAPRSISYKRNPDYWGKEHAINKGRYNFDIISYDYYRDETVAVEAIKAGKYDLRLENISRIWSTAYENQAIKDGLLKKEEVSHQIPNGMQGFVLNTRRDKFKDAKTRFALNYAFDYEWANKNLFYGLYKRTRSFFSNSPFEAKGVPTGKELEILEKYRGKIPEEVFTTEYNPPATDGSGNNRENLLKAKKLLEEAGWKLEGGKLLDAKGQPFEIEFLIDSPSFERVFSNYTQSLKRLGINATIRNVDSAQMQKRQENFDFDVIVHVFAQSMSPGNEQIDYWHSSKVEERGSRNLIGVHDKVVDELIEKILTAQDKETLIAATSSLDRVLQWSHYVIPNWHSRVFRIVFWDRFGRPQISPKYDLGFTDTWWSDAEKSKKVDAYLKK